jgi:hypothetical protein
VTTTEANTAFVEQALTDKASGLWETVTFLGENVVSGSRMVGEHTSGTRSQVVAFVRVTVALDGG